jgi:hypothetical protein
MPSLISPLAFRFAFHAPKRPRQMAGKSWVLPRQSVRKCQVVSEEISQPKALEIRGNTTSDLRMGLTRAGSQEKKITAVIIDKPLDRPGNAAPPARARGEKVRWALTLARKFYSCWLIS